MESERYRLREEQRQAVQQTYNYWRKSQYNKSVEPRFLWNAKPRFGKTLAAYGFAAKIQAVRILIITNRPAVADSWYADFIKFDFRDAGQTDGQFRWIFTSSAASRKYLGDTKNILTRKEQAKNPKLLAKNFIHFISLQDIKGRKQGDFKNKNAWIFELEWDLVIIDESHEGVSTEKAFSVFERTKRKFTLHLSGTPFQSLLNKDFRNDQIFNWSYVDEQKAKEAWPSKEGPNPYADRPKMQIMTYRLPRILELTEDELKCEGSGYGFDLAEFLRVAKIDGVEKFVYEAKVKLFVRNLASSNYPFAEKKSQELLRHTFWLLPSIKACEQMKKLLLEDEFFGENYSAQNIILAAGNGDSDRVVEAALIEVKRRIGEHPDQSRTITLSCGQLTTGVTIPAWTGVIMLNKCKSPSLYMQTIFRAQNGLRMGAWLKKDCCVFDFAPERALEILADIADPEVSPAAIRKKKIQELINYMPVFVETESGEMRKITADEALTLPLKNATEEVVNRGFMSNQLFRNIGKIFGGPKDIRAIIMRFDEVKANGEVKRQHKAELPTLAVPEWREGESEGGVRNKRRIKSAEEIIRDRLRGFARTIPSFLMAYGDDDTTLENFEEGVPEKIFEELTNITKDDFRKLRDGVDYKQVRADGKQAESHFDGLFNADVFNAAIQEFNRKRKQMARYFDPELNGDIFTYIPSQHNNQFFTPRMVVIEMVDKLEKLWPEIFADPENTFIDPYMKSGLFIAEIVKRIFAATRRRYSSDKACIKFILENQVYGLTPTPVLTAITQRFLFGFDDKQEISRDNFQEYDITDEARRGAVPDLLEDIFKRGGAEMKFTVVIGNPPYQTTVGNSAVQTQSNSSWIYQYFQNSADQIGEISCLIYPFGGWFDAPERLGGFGRKLLSDGHTVSVNAYEATPDRRAWYRQDRSPQPIFGTSANLSAGVAIVLRDLRKSYDKFEYSNRIYTEEKVMLDVNNDEVLPPNPAFLKIAQKLHGKKLVERVEKNLFGIESSFVEQNPEKVSHRKSDWPDPIQLLANDHAGPTGRTQCYWTDRSNIPRGKEYLGQTKVIMTSAYPKKSLVSGTPTIKNVQARAKVMIEILPAGSAFGASRLALMMSNEAKECENFLKYTQTEFFAALLLQEPNQRSAVGVVIPDQDFSGSSDIDWSRSVAEISQQLCRKYELTADELEFLGIKSE